MEEYMIRLFCLHETACHCHRIENLKKNIELNITAGSREVTE